MFSRSKRNEEQIHVWQGKPPVNLLCTCQDNVNYSIISPYHRLCFGSNHWSKMNSVRSCCMSVFVFLLERLHARSVRALGFGYGDQIIWCFLGLFMPSSQSDYPPLYCLRDSGPYQPGKLQFLITCWLFKRLATGVVLLIQFRSNVSQAVLSLVWFLGDGRSPLRCGNGVCGSPSSGFCRYVGLFYSGAAK